MLLAGREDSVLIQNVYKYLGWTPQDQDFKFNPDHVSDVSVKPTQRSHPMQLRSAAANEISSIDNGFNPFNIGWFLQNNSVLTWVNN